MLQRFDEQVQQAVADKFDLGIMSEQEVLDMYTPIRLAGWGYKKWAEIAPYAWFAAQAQAALFFPASRHATSKKNHEMRQSVLDQVHAMLAESKADNAHLKECLPPCPWPK